MSSAPTGLNVLLDEKRVNDLLEQKSGLKAFIRQGCNVVLFMIFLALYTLLALGEPYGDMRAFEGFVRRRFDKDAPIPLRQVESASTFWQYTYQSFLPAVYGQNTARYYYPGATVDTLLPIEASGGNRLFGVGRLRMLKMTPGSDCSVPDAFAASFGSCFGPYSEAAEDTENFGPISNDGGKAFRYYPSSGGYNFHGEMGTYPQTGFMKAITPNYIQTLSDFQYMEQQNFVTEATRALFYEFTLYNFNLGLYAVCRIAFEVSPSGNWQKSFEVEVLTQRHLTALGFGSTVDWLMLVGEVILFLFVLRYLMEELSEFCSATRKLDYFADAWNILDLVNLFMIIAALGLRISAWVAGGSLQVFTGPADSQGLQTFTDYSLAAQEVRTLRGVVAFNAVLTWFKTVKYYNVVPYIRVFMHTVSKSQRMLVSFVIIFCTIHFGFVVSYSVAFGQSFLDLRTPWKANIFLLRVFLGDGNFQQILDIAPNVGPLLMMLVILGMIFILMNLFSAIMIRALADAKKSQDAQMAKQWEQIVDRAAVAWKATKEGFKLEMRFRSAVPGLYSRLVRRNKKQEELETKRDLALLLRQMANRPDDLLALGPGSPTCGRRQKRALASVAVKDDDSDDSSEADLGPLFAREQLQTKGMLLDSGAGGGNPGRNDPGLGLPALADSQAPSPPDDENAQAVDLLIKATRHVSASVVERTRGARGVLFGEMADSREVLLGVGAVLEVLGRRARDLEAQQANLLKTI